MAEQAVALTARPESFTFINRPPPARPLNVLLVGYEDQDNLGLRYLCAAARASGHVVEMITYEADAAPIEAAARAMDADVIGLSLIFQYMAPQFGSIVQALRTSGVTAHITMGGHYPSFDPSEVLDRIPGLDSIVRFEGEETLVELLDYLASERDWTGLSGLACRDGDGIVRVNGHREPIEDLDSIPWPERSDIDYESSELPTASILASRGCPWDCSFCSIRPFYEEQTTEHGGRLRRIRQAIDVVNEMEFLHRERGVRIFLFQDDDFMGGGKRARRWAIELAEQIRQRNLQDQIGWKISCRSDEIDVDTFRILKSAGLTHVYMGVESGDPDSLTRMSKRISPERHIEAGEALREIDLSFDFGFMLLDPGSTFGEVRNNLDFLDRFVGDGWTVATFCRMLPYSGTPLERELKEAGRLGGTPFEPDYKFNDPKIDLFYEWILATFRERNFTNQGLCHILRVLRFESELGSGAVVQYTRSQRAYLRYLTARCNRSATTTIRSAVDYIEAANIEDLTVADGLLGRLSEREQHEQRTLIGLVSSLYEQVHSLPDPTSALDVKDADDIGGFSSTWTARPDDIKRPYAPARA